MRDALNHWRQELLAALNAGKLVVVLLDKPTEVFAATGSVEHSGSGRNTRTTRHVDQISSYNSLPTSIKFVSASGSTMQLLPKAQILKPYWAEFEDRSTYHVYLEGSINTPLLKTKSGDRIVAAAVKAMGGGTGLLLPFIDLADDSFIETRNNNKGEQGRYFTKEGITFGKRFVAALVAIADALKAENSEEPPPAWVEETEYQSLKEKILKDQIAGVSLEIVALDKKRQSLEIDHQTAGSLCKLLYEQGKPLELAVLESLTLMGFQASRFEGAGSEFDAIFISEEGRFIGEVEGKDNKAINIDKFSQLERNINEDFKREEVSSPAHGVLFGNAFRLMPIAKREAAFTEKCLQAAKRTGATLIRTCDLFAPASFLKNTVDANYAKRCREAIYKGSRGIAVFPPPPETK